VFEIALDLHRTTHPPRFCSTLYKKSVRPEFFDKIRDKKWSVVFEKPQNMMKWGMGNGRYWCGPYFVYLIEIQMERRSGQIEIVSKEADPSKNR